MEKLSSFYDHITERLRSPLIFSFVVSWLVINWRIPVYLFWFDEATLLQHGYKNHIAFIESVLSFYSAFLWPFIAALIYTFGYPQVKNWIAWYQTWVSKIGDKKQFKISDGAVVSFSRYDAKVKKLLQREKELVEMMEKESETIQEHSNKNTNLTREILELKLGLERAEADKEGLNYRLNQTTSELLMTQDATNINRFQGTWNVQIENERVEWKIEGSGIQELDESLTVLHPHSMEFSYWKAKNDGRIILMLHLMGEQNKWVQLFPNHRIYTRLHSNGEGTILSGNTTEGYKIVMRKIV